jgi:hypothetical protein
MSIKCSRRSIKLSSGALSTDNSPFADVGFLTRRNRRRELDEGGAPRR